MEEAGTSQETPDQIDYCTKAESQGCGKKSGPNLSQLDRQHEGGQEGKLRVTKIRRQIMNRLAELREGTTMCPGRLARDCGSNLRLIRPDLLALAEQGKITLSQRGDVVTASNFKGPFRVRSNSTA